MFSSIFQWSYFNWASSYSYHNSKIKVFKLCRGPVRVNHEIIHSAMEIYTYFYSLHTLLRGTTLNWKVQIVKIKISPYPVRDIFWNDILSYTDNNDYYHQIRGQQSHQISSTIFCSESSMTLNDFLPFDGELFSTTSHEVDMAVVSTTHCIGKLCTIKT